MFYLSREVELTDKLLQKIMNSFLMSARPIRRKYKDYYDGKQKILQKTYSDASKPCNKVITNYCSDIVYPSIFDTKEMEEERQKQQDELSALRFKQFAQAFNKKFKEGGANE